MKNKIQNVLAGTPFQELPEHLRQRIEELHLSMADVTLRNRQPKPKDIPNIEIDSEDLSIVTDALNQIYAIQFSLWSNCKRLPHELLADLWFTRVMNAPPYYYTLQVHSKTPSPSDNAKLITPDEVPKIERTVLFETTPPSMRLLKELCRGRASKDQIKELREGLIEASRHCRLMRDALARISDDLGADVPKSERNCLVFQYYINMIICLMKGVDFSGQYLLRSKPVVGAHTLH